jgi:ribosomal protein L37AE/L43A
MNKRIKKKKRKPCEICGRLDHSKEEMGLELCNSCYENEQKREYDYGD